MKTEDNGINHLPLCIEMSAPSQSSALCNYTSHKCSMKIIKKYDFLKQKQTNVHKYRIEGNNEHKS